MITVKISTQILAGNIGGEWSNQRAAADSFAEFLEAELESEARAIFGEDAEINVDIDVQHNASGASQALSLTAHDDEGLVGWEHEDTLKEIQHRAWEKWLDTEAAASLTALPTDGDMHTYHVSEEFVTPPEKQGQIVTLSYAYDPEAGVIIERTHDASDGTVRFDAYADPDDGSDWAPWSGTPSLGAHLGECSVTMEDVS